MNRKMKSRRKTVLLIVAVFVAVVGALVFFNLPKPIKAYDNSFDLSKINNGVYAGNCNNGIVQVDVEVTVEDHMISYVVITRHQNGLGGDAEVIVDTVVRRQSVEVDAVSGATMSSRTILKAVENALMSANP